MSRLTSLSMAPPAAGRRGRAAATPRRGLASLVVVAILLAAMAALAVFVNRNLLIEQGTSANQYRSTIAMEAAEAGLEWAMAMLNKPEKVDANCATSTQSADVRFRVKYLTSDIDTGLLAAGAGPVHAACVANPAGTNWICNCPAAGTAPNPVAAAPTTGFQPGFAVTFESTTVPGVVRVVSRGCSSRITTTTCDGDAAATVSIALGSIPGVTTPPAAALTARGTVSIGNAALGVINGDPTTNGITINAGMGIDATNLRITTVPGTPPQSTLVGNDASLRDTTEAQMFSTFFGMTKEAYQQLSGVKRLTCPCTETTVTNAYDGGARMLWLEGNLEMNANLTIGSETEPVLLVVNGNVTMRGNLNVYGLMYSTAITWDNTGGGSALLRGAAISEGNYTGNGTPDYFYDAKVLRRLRADQGTFTRVPGSWRDF